jgi:hypothetical protein
MVRSVVPVHAVWHSGHTACARVNLEWEAPSCGTRITEEPPKPISLKRPHDARTEEKNTTELGCVERLRGTGHACENSGSRNAWVGKVTREGENGEPIFVDLHRWREGRGIVRGEVMSDPRVVDGDIPVSTGH